MADFVGFAGDGKYDLPGRMFGGVVLRPLKAFMVQMAFDIEWLFCSNCMNMKRWGRDKSQPHIYEQVIQLIQKRLFKMRIE